MSNSNNKGETIITSSQMQKEAFSISDRIDLIIELDLKLLNILDEFKDKKWDSLKDSRMLFFRYITELNSNTILQFAFHAESYQLTRDKVWLKKRLPHLAENIDRVSDIDNYSANRNNNISSIIWDTFILSYFNEFETRLRSVVRNLALVRNVNKTKSKASLNGNEGFYLIYRGLFEDYLNFDKIDYEVLKIFAAIRNSIHNSGIFFSPDKKPKIFNYRGKTYHFVYGKPINFLTSDFIGNMLYDLLELWGKLLRNNKIFSISLIKDPIADVKFE